MNEFKNYKKKLFCCNCGKFGHKYSKCNEPITSLGIIAIKSTSNEQNRNLLEYFNKDKYFNLVKSNTMNNNILLDIQSYLKKFKFLMIRRKKTLGYIEFIRGRYDETNLESYTRLFEQMVPSEIKDIEDNTFEYLWDELWKKNIDNKFYKNEFQESKQKFDILKNSNNFSIFLQNINILYNIPEWGYPKGRRIYLEKNINCACREFEEETSLKKEDYNILTNIPPIQEVFYGTNKILYKHIYYFALCDADIDVSLDTSNPNQIEEIGDIGWFDYNECRSLIRSYHYERQKILNETFIFLSSIIANKYLVDESIISDKDLDDNNFNIINTNKSSFDKNLNDIMNDSDDDDDVDELDVYDDDDNDESPFFKFES
jgi:8-oxo-dGTP pyrophosphatase MutT (NUDIX family)